MDSRANIKISFDVFSCKFKQEFWINYWIKDFDGYEVDERILEWFDECWQKASEKYHLDRASREAKKFEEEERTELKRLKAKYK